MDCGSVEHENNLQLFIRGNGAHGNRVSPNCAGFDLGKKERKRKEKKSEKKTTQNQYKTKRNGSVQLVSHLMLRLNYAPPDASLTPGMSS